MIDFIVEFGSFIINLIQESPDFFKHVLSFLKDIVTSIKDVFVSGNILLGILLVLILIKIIGYIRKAI